MKPRSYSEVVDLVKKGDPEAKCALSQRFFPRMMAHVRQYLYTRIHEKDVFVFDSILESVVRHHAEDSIDWTDESSLVFMIGGVALKHCDKHNKRSQRDPQRDVQHVPIDVAVERAGRADAGFDPTDDEPPPAARIEYADFLLNRFTERQRTIIQMTLEDETRVDIAKNLDCSTKTIDRELATIGSILSEELRS